LPTTHNSTEPKVLAIAPNSASASSSAPAPSTETAKPVSNLRVFIIAGLIALLAIAAIGRMWWRSQNLVETENAYVAGHVHPLSARISGVVTRVLVEDNQIVKKGDVIAELDPADQKVKIEQIEAQIYSAEQQILQADAQVAQVKAQASATAAQVGQAEAQLLRTRQDAERYGQLFNSQMKAVSKAELDAANANYTSAQADVKARHELVLGAQAQIAAATSSREVIKAQIKVLQTQRKDAVQQLAYNQILAPVTGRFGKRNVETGARIQAGQQLGAIVEDTVWITANFKRNPTSRSAPRATGEDCD